MQKVKAVKDGVEIEVELEGKYFSTQEEYDRVLKSEVSKGKGEILKALGASSIEEIKTKIEKKEGDISKLDELSKKFETVQAELKKEKNLRAASDLRIKPELRDDVITLAEASLEDGKTFEEILKIKAIKLGAIEEKKEPKEKPLVHGFGKKPNVTIEKLSKEEEAEMKALRDLI